MDLNKVMVIGRITSDLEVKKMEASGASVVNFSVATNRKYKNKEWNVVEESEFHRCVAFGNAADLIGQYLSKGSKVYIEGRLKTRKWEDSNGTTRYTTEIIVENFIFLDSKGWSGNDTSSESNYSAQSADTSSQEDEELPF